MRPQRYLIIGGALLVDTKRIAQEVGGVCWRHGRIITGDDHGVNAEVARQARLLNVPVQRFGITRRATCSGTYYMRVLVSPALPRAERLKLRDRFMVQLADYVIVVGDHPVLEYAQTLEKRYLYAVN